MNAVDQGSSQSSFQELAQFIIDGGIKEAIGQPEIREYCLKELRDLGCVPPTNRIVLLACVRAGSPAFHFAIKTLGGNLSDFLQRHPLIAQLFMRLANLCAKHRRKDALRKHYLAFMKGEQKGTFRLEQGDDYSLVRDAITHDQLTAIRSAVGNIQDTVAREIDRVIESLRLDPLALTDQWDQNPDVRSISDRIRYDSRHYRFLGREAEIDFLQRFLGEPVAWNADIAFRWLLLTGAGGTGKTRLAMEFVRHHLLEGWTGARIPLLELDTILNAAPLWQPRSPTLLVIDYPAQKPKQTKQLLDRLARRSEDLLHPVRILLVERTAEDDWFDQVFDHGLLRHAFEWNGVRLDRGRKLEPLGWNSIRQIMRTELADFALPEEDFETLEKLMTRVDPQACGPSDASLATPPPPRPLFALAAIEWAKSQLEADGTIDQALATAEGKHEVFAAILKKDRDKFWHPACKANDAVLGLHENLLALASFTLGLVGQSRVRERVDGLGIESLFPAASNLGVLNTVSAVTEGKLEQLEPDLLGEFHALTRLDEIRIEHGREAMQSFCTLAYRAGGDQAAIFASRCIRDFPELTREKEFLRPNRNCSDKEFFSYLGALLYVASDLAPEEAWPLIKPHFARVRLSQPDDEFDAIDRYARILSNLAANVGSEEHARIRESIFKQFDQMALLTGDQEKLAENEGSALVLLAWGARNNKSTEAVPLIYQRMDRLADKFPANESIGKAQADILCQLAAFHQELEQPELVLDSIGRFSVLAHRFPNDRNIARNEAQYFYVQSAFWQEFGTLPEFLQHWRKSFGRIDPKDQKAVDYYFGSLIVVAYFSLLKKHPIAEDQAAEVALSAHAILQLTGGLALPDVFKKFMLRTVKRLHREFPGMREVQMVVDLFADAQITLENTPDI